MRRQGYLGLNSVPGPELPLQGVGPPTLPAPSVPLLHGQVHRMPERGCRLRGAAGGSWKAGQALRGRPVWYEHASSPTEDMLNLAQAVGSFRCRV